MARPRLLDTAAENLGRMMPPRLSIDANRFTLIDGSGNEKPLNTLNLDVVFIDLNPKVSKMYWGKEYSVNDAGGDIPLCWSDNGTAPSSQASAPQSQQCFNCPHNAIGSAVSKFSGAKIKACVDMKKLAFIVPDDPSRLVYLMTIKPGSFKNWTTTVNWLKGQRMGDISPDLCDVVIRMEFESQGVLKFTPVQAVIGNAALEAQREEAWSCNVTDEIVGKTDVPHSGALLAAAPVQQLAPPPQPAAAPPLAPGYAPNPATLNTGAQVQQPVPFAAQPPAPLASSPTAGEPPKRRSRKPAAAAEPAPTTAPFLNPQPAPPVAATPPVQQPPASQGQAADLEIPAFLQRAPAPVQPAPPPTGQQFGLATPAAADPGMMKAIEDAFKLPT